MSRNTNLLTDAQNKFWYQVGQCIEDQRELSNRAFYAGARWDLKQTSELSPYIARFIEMMVLLGFLESESEEENVNQTLTSASLESSEGAV